MLRVIEKVKPDEFFQFKDGKRVYPYQNGLSLHYVQNTITVYDATPERARFALATILRAQSYEMLTHAAELEAFAHEDEPSCNGGCSL